jgi:hypothetical protein
MPLQLRTTDDVYDEIDAGRAAHFASELVMEFNAQQKCNVRSFRVDYFGAMHTVFPCSQACAHT